MTAPTATIILTGGPDDGASYTVPERLHVFWLPVVSPPAWAFVKDEELGLYSVAPVQHKQYELLYDCGYPSRDDQGRYRYGYAGRR